jgi:hypothetical protein
MTIESGSLVATKSEEQYLVTRVGKQGVYGKRCSAQEYAEGLDLGGRFEYYLGAPETLSEVE